MAEYLPILRQVAHRGCEADECEWTTGTGDGAPGQNAELGQGVDPRTRVVGVSRRIWVAFVLLGGLLVYTGFGMFTSRSELRELQTRATEAELKLEAAVAANKQAQADKEQVIKELAEQGKRLAEFSRGEEQAKSALAAASSGAEEAEKELAKLKAQLSKAQKQARSGRRAQAQLKKLKEEVLALQTALDGTRAELEAVQFELEKVRAEPYSPQQPVQPRQ